jgi:uncharacterized protein (DUF736 family)
MRAEQFVQANYLLEGGAILVLKAKGVRIVAETNPSNDKAPSHRVFVGRADYAERGVMRSGVV